MNDTSFFGGSDPRKGAVRASERYKDGVRVDKYGNELEGIGAVNNTPKSDSGYDVTNTDLFNELFGDSAEALKQAKPDVPQHEFVKITSVKRPPVPSNQGGKESDKTSDSHSTK